MKHNALMASETFVWKRSWTVLIVFQGLLWIFWEERKLRLSAERSFTVWQKYYLRHVEKVKFNFYQPSFINFDFFPLYRATFFLSLKLCKIFRDFLNEWIFHFFAADFICLKSVIPLQIVYEFSNLQLFQTI